MTQPEALRLADALTESAGDYWQFDKSLGYGAAAELRRLHQFAEDQIGRATTAEAALQMTKVTHALKIAAVEAQRDALLEALKDATKTIEHLGYPLAAIERARAAIEAAEGEQR